MNLRSSFYSLLFVVLSTSTVFGTTIPSGTKLKVRLTQEISRASDQVDAELTEDVKVNGKVVLASGTPCVAEVSEDQNSDPSQIELVLIRRPEHDYMISTNSIVLNGDKQSQANQRRQDGMQAVRDTVRGAITGRPLDPADTGPITIGKGSPGGAGIVPHASVLTFKLRKAVTIDDEPPAKQVQSN